MKKKVLGFGLSVVLALGVCTTSLAADTSYSWGGSSWGSSWGSNWGSGNWSNWWGQNNGGQEEEPSTPDYAAPIAELNENKITDNRIRNLSIKWEDPNEAEEVKYIIRRSMASDFSIDCTETEISGDKTSGGWRIGGNSPINIQATSTLYVQVKAVYADGESDWSNTVVAPGK